jgi:hypothetical protein
MFTEWCGDRHVFTREERVVQMLSKQLRTAMAAEHSEHLQACSRITKEFLVGGTEMFSIYSLMSSLIRSLTGVWAFY